MAITRYRDPWSDLLRLPTQMDRLLSGIWAEGGTPTECAVGVPIDVYDTEKDVTLEVDLPGVAKDDINLRIEEDTLVIEGERKAPEEDRNWLRREKCYGSFRRALRFPFAVNEEKVSAEFKDGVLEIHLPKAEPEPPKRKQITIK